MKTMTLDAEPEREDGGVAVAEVSPVNISNACPRFSTSSERVEAVSAVGGGGTGGAVNVEAVGLVQTGNPVGPVIRFRPAKLFLGRQLLRICGTKANPAACEDCHLRAFCRCAQADFTAAAAVEARVWMALAVCGAVAILYVVWSSFRPG